MSTRYVEPALYALVFAYVPYYLCKFVNRRNALFRDGGLDSVGARFERRHCAGRGHIYGVGSLYE